MSTCFVSLSVFAHTYYDQHAVGWHWYEDPVEIKPLKTLSPTKVSPLEEAPRDPIARLHSAQKTIERALDTAILEPTESHVSAYLRLQNELSQRSAQFAALWQRVLLQYPELDFSLYHPTEAVALHVQQDRENKNLDAAIKTFAAASGLFFFYKASCPYCVRFAPLVQHFAARYGITVIPITLDGQILPEFPDSKQDKGQAAQFGVKHIPALFAVNPQTHRAFPVAYGLTSEATVRQRIAQSQLLLRNAP